VVTYSFDLTSEFLNTSLAFLRGLEAVGTLSHFCFSDRTWTNRKLNSVFQWNSGSASSHGVQKCSTRSWMTKPSWLPLGETHPRRRRGGSMTCKTWFRRHSARTRRRTTGRPGHLLPRRRLRSEPSGLGDERKHGFCFCPAILVADDPPDLTVLASPYFLPIRWPHRDRNHAHLCLYI